MGEVMPILIVGFVVLALMTMVIAKTQLNRKAVVKSMDEEDLVERVKIHLTAEQSKTLAEKLVAANNTATQNTVIDMYEVGTDRLLRFEVDKGVKPEPKKDKK